MRTALVSAFLVATAACYAPSYTDETHCGPAGECPAGRQCVDHTFCQALVPEMPDAPQLADARSADGPTEVTPDAPQPADAGSADGPIVVTPDAPPPPPPDAPAATYSGAILVHDEEWLDEPNAGHGGHITIAFNKNGTPVESPRFSGPPIPPCVASYVDVTKDSERNPDLDEGIVWTSGALAARIPDCTFIGTTYRCAGAPPLRSSGGTIAPAANNPESVLVYTDGNAGSSYGAEVIGRWLLVESDPRKGLALPIIGASGNRLVVLRMGLPETSAALGGSLIAAGLGPVALQASVDGTITGVSPEFLQDGDSVSIGLTAGGGMHFPSFAPQTIKAGNAFSLDSASLALLDSGIDLNTPNAVILGCAGPGGAGCASTDVATIVLIDTSDADTFPGGLTDLGTPRRFRAQLTCAAFDRQVSIPAAAIAVLKAAQPTKMRITVARDRFAVLASGINILAGHSVVKFQLVTR